MTDRVSYSYGIKWPGPTDYSSVHCDISYSTDVRDDETPEQAVSRARKFVQDQCEGDFDEIRRAREEV